MAFAAFIALDFMADFGMSVRADQDALREASGKLEGRRLLCGGATRRFGRDPSIGSLRLAEALTGETASEQSRCARVAATTEAGQPLDLFWANSTVKARHAGKNVRCGSCH